MNNNKIELKENNNELRIELIVNSSSGISQIILIALLVLPVFGFIAFTYLIITSFRQPEISWFLGAIMMLLVAWYFVRLLLWNKGGKEVIIINDNLLTQYSDYNWFRMGKEKYEFNEIYILKHNVEGVVESSNENVLDDFRKEGGRYLLGFELDNKTIIETSVDIPLFELKKAIHVIELYINKN